MQCILYKIYFWKVFCMYYNLICIFICTPMWTKNFILVKKWVLHAHSGGGVLDLWPRWSTGGGEGQYLARGEGGGHNGDSLIVGDPPHGITCVGPV
jgi:hypothetical protein